MIDAFKELLEKVSEPSDLATILICGTAGFLVDAGLNAVGFLEPGYVGITAASGALGLKKGAEAAWTARQTRKKRIEDIENVRVKANSLLKLLGSKGDQDLVQQLERDIELFDSGIVGAESLESSIQETIRAYQSGKKSTEKIPREKIEKTASAP